MPWQEVERDLRNLGSDAREVAEDVRELGADLGRQARVAGDDVVTAEYLATGGALEWFSGWVDDGLEGVSIISDQWRLYFEDAVDTALAVSRARSIDDVTVIPGEHARRRFRHVRDGVERSLDLAERSWQRSLDPLRTVWRPFLNMVRDDFS